MMAAAIHAPIFAADAPRGLFTTQLKVSVGVTRSQAVDHAAGELDAKAGRSVVDAVEILKGLALAVDQDRIELRVLQRGHVLLGQIG